MPKFSFVDKSGATGSVEAADANAALATAPNIAPHSGVSEDTTVPGIPSTPAVISSKDVAGSYDANSSALDAKTKALGASVNGGSTPNDQTPQTTIDQNAGKGTKGKPASTGDPIYDSLQADRAAKDATFEKQAAARKKEYDNLFNKSFAAVDATFAATVANLKSTYEARIGEQRRINALDIGRTKAYGLASGGALAAPIEFTNAVSQREEAAAKKITDLDNERTALIAKAAAARDEGDAKLLEAHLDDITKIESELRENIKAVADEAQSQYQMLTQIRKDQEAKQKEQKLALVAAATVKYGNEFKGAKDSATKDALVKKIIAESGGVLDYATVLSTLTDVTTKEEMDALEMEAKRADISQSKASTAKTWNDIKIDNAQNARAAAAARAGTPENAHSAINQLLGMKDAEGRPYSDANGYMTPVGFNSLVRAAAEDKITRSAFLDQYGWMLYDGGDSSYPGYNLTGAEKKKLSGE